MKHPFLFFLLFSFFFLAFSGPCLAVPLEGTYPTIPGTPELTAASTLPQYLNYLFNFGMMIGFTAVVITLIIGGIIYVFSTINPGARAVAKDRISGAITGFGILLFVYIIAVTINPQLVIFKFDWTLPPLTFPPADQGDTSRVDLCIGNNCQTDPLPTGQASFYSLKESASDLNIFTNKINSINIRDYSPSGSCTGANDTCYIAILHDLVNYQGRCQYFSYGACNANIEPFAASASIFKYKPNPSGAGVTFYRNPFGGPGGAFTVENSDIAGIYQAQLKDLTFMGWVPDPNDPSAPPTWGCTVPKKEQDCTAWKFDGTCEIGARRCPTLANKNISSISINGDYAVILLYLAESSASPYQWTACQVYPTVDDIRKGGPHQIKWDYIINHGNSPNWVVILPIKK